MPEDNGAKRKGLNRLILENVVLIAVLFAALSLAGLVAVNLVEGQISDSVGLSILHDFFLALFFAATAGLFYEWISRTRLIRLLKEPAFEGASEVLAPIIEAFDERLLQCKAVHCKTFSSIADALRDEDLESALRNGHRVDIVGYTTATTQEVLLVEPYVRYLEGKDVHVYVRSPEAPLPFESAQPSVDIAKQYYAQHRGQGIRDRVGNYWQEKLAGRAATLTIKYYDCAPFGAGLLVDNTIGVVQLFRPDVKQVDGCDIIDYAARPSGPFSVLRVSPQSVYEMQLLEYFRTWIHRVDDLISVQPGSATSGT